MKGGHQAKFDNLISHIIVDIFLYYFIFIFSLNFETWCFSEV